MTRRDSIWMQRANKFGTEGVYFLRILFLIDRISTPRKLLDYVAEGFYARKVWPQTRLQKYSQLYFIVPQGSTRALFFLLHKQRSLLPVPRYRSRFLVSVYCLGITYEWPRSQIEKIRLPAIKTAIPAKLTPLTSAGVDDSCSCSAGIQSHRRQLNWENLLVSFTALIASSSRLLKWLNSRKSIFSTVVVGIVYRTVVWSLLE